jgi:hypothetical protein
MTMTTDNIGRKRKIDGIFARNPHFSLGKAFFNGILVTWLSFFHHRPLP